MTFSQTFKRQTCTNFADDNTLSAFGSTIDGLIKVLESKSKLAIEWFKSNEMIDNPRKFQAILLDKRQQNQEVSLQKLMIKLLIPYYLVGAQTDDKLNFNLHL